MSVESALLVSGMASERAPPLDVMKSSTGEEKWVGTALKARVLTFDVEGIGGSGGQACQSAEHQHERKMFHLEIPRSSSLDLP